jgi:hypothetical protein
MSRSSIRQYVRVPSNKHAPTRDLLDDLQATLLEMHANRIEAGGTSRTWNRLFNHAQALHLILRERPDGRDGIAALMESAVDTVQMSAEAWSLSWAEARARQVLTELEASSGLAAVDAKWTLREFDRGRLNTTWEPRRR